MANPQTENGHTMLANEILEALAKYRIPGEQMQCLLHIIRKTYGYKKKEDAISNSQFVKATGLKKGNVCRALKELSKKQLVIKSDNIKVPTYRFNKDYDQWIVLSKKKPVIKKATTVIKNDNKVLSKVMDTKERKKLLQKKYEKDICECVICYLNSKTKKNYRLTDTNQTLILSRVREGFELDDFILAIDNQVREWRDDEKMSKYLRPSTLFQKSKFDGYVNNITRLAEWV